MKNIICYNVETGIREDNLYKPSDFLPHGTFIVNDDGSLDVYDDVYITNYVDIKYLPFQFRYIVGSFNCHSNSLRSLQGCPIYVNEMFDCSRNNLKSLKFSPKIVGNGSYAFANELIDVKGSSLSIGGSFDCMRNNITSSKGYPKHIEYILYLDYDIKDVRYGLDYYFAT